MAESESKSSSPQKSSKSSSGPKRGEYVNEGQEAYEAGYWGTRDNPYADEEFALTTGPNAPLQDLQGNPIDIDKDDHIQKEPEEK